MNGLASLLKKEIKEQIRTYRLLIVGGIFLFFGLTTPLLLKYLPEIIKLSGTEVPINIPPPTAVQSLTEFSGTIGQLGVLMAVLITMGSVANELRQGTAVMTLIKPVTRAAFVNAKFIAAGLTFIVSLAVAALFCYVYTILLISTADPVPFIVLNMLLGLFLLFCLAVTIFFSSLFKSSLAAGGLAIGVLIAQAILSTVPVIGIYLPGKLLTWGTGLVNGDRTSHWGAFGVTIAAIFVLTYFAQNRLSKKEF